MIEMVSDYVYAFSSCIFRSKARAQRTEAEIVSSDLSYRGDSAVDVHKTMITVGLIVYRQNKFKRRAETCVGKHFVVSNSATLVTGFKKKNWSSLLINNDFKCVLNLYSIQSSKAGVFIMKFILDEYITYVAGVQF